MNFLLLFLVVARQVELEDVAGRACELLGFLPSNCPPGHRTLVWRGQLSLLLLFQVEFVHSDNSDKSPFSGNLHIPPGVFVDITCVPPRRGVWMLVRRPPGWPRPSARRPKSSTTRPRRSLADWPSGGPSGRTWRAWPRSSRRAPASTYRRRSCSTRASIGCCAPAASRS